MICFNESCTFFKHLFIQKISESYSSKQWYSSQGSHTGITDCSKPKGEVASSGIFRAS
jgi:hypothetical protein